MSRGPSRPFPSIGLKEALVLPQGIRDENAGHPMNRILLAGALDTAAASSAYRDLIAAANKFGLISGNYNSENISLTELGERATAAGASGEDRLNAMRQAMENVPLFKRMLDHYNNARLPSREVLKGTLEKSPFNVPSEWSAEAARVFEETGRLTGVVRAMKGGTPYVVREAGPPIREEPIQDEVGEDETTDREFERPPTPATAAAAVAEAAATPAGSGSPSSRQFFIAHGKDKDALKQLQDFLRDLDVPYVVAEEEPNAGRPISQKIADLMRSCSAGIFIFSGDEDVTDTKGDTVRRPRPNVVYELGAASFQYGQRIVVFKEQGVEFPTDFRDLGYIEYEKGRLGAKSMELLRELIKLKAVRVMPGG